MRGLLIKDMRLLSKYKKTYVIYLLVIAAMMIRLNNTDNVAFIAGYTIMIVGIFATNTISMDYNGQCLPYIMTLPVTRKTYVAEKYILYMLSSFLSAFAVMLIFSLIKISSVDKFGTYLVEIFLCYIIIGTYNMIMLPLQFKYNDRARNILFIILAVMIIAGVTISNSNNSLIVERLHLSVFKTGMSGFAKWLNELENQPSKLISFFILWLICWGISYFISERVIQNQEF